MPSVAFTKNCPNDQVTSNTAPAHSHATGVAMYPALLKPLMRPQTLLPQAAAVASDQNCAAACHGHVSRLEISQFLKLKKKIFYVFIQGFYINIHFR